MGIMIYSVFLGHAGFISSTVLSQSEAPKPQRTRTELPEFGACRIRIGFL